MLFKTYNDVYNLKLSFVKIDHTYIILLLLSKVNILSQ